jgi:N-acetyl-gamma-glutamyl-phosphate/LysW-gamma-L-alpha-aminoadipyl-6-phosphate reductase
VMVKVGVLGGSGYVGGELIRLLLSHPEADLVFASSSRFKDEYVFRAHPNLRGLTQLKFTGESSIASSTPDVDLVFSALPHGESVKHLPSLVQTGVKIVDLSADFRLKDPAAYPKWYGYTHPHPELLERFVLSIPELNREEVGGVSLASSPGCMAIATILGVAPLLLSKSLKIDAGRIVVDLKVGSSGSGGRPSLATHFSERFGVVRAYKPVGHRHTAEIEQELAKFTNDGVKAYLSAHSVNMVRGILATIHLFVGDAVEPLEVWRAYRSAYTGKRFIRLVRDRKGVFRYPDPKLVIGSNYADIGFELEPGGGRIVVLVAIDNLVKGAAGNALQTMNIMLGLDEWLGLESAPLHPV